MSTTKNIRTTTTQRTAWAIPVKVEELKAGLEAYAAAEDRLSALTSAIDLPNTVLDIIMAHVFGFWHDKLLLQWTRAYLCSSTIEDSRVLGTVTLRARKIDGFWEDTWDIYMIYKQGLERLGCEGCNAVRAYNFIEWYDQECPDLDYYDAREKWDNTTPCCEPCEALKRDVKAVRAAKEQEYRWSEISTNEESADTQCPPSAELGQERSSTKYPIDYLTEVDNVYDSHPHSDRMFEHIYFDGGWLYGHTEGQRAWVRARRSLATDWHATIELELLFTERNIKTLKDFGVECILRQNKSSEIYKHTTALLVPHDAVKSTKSKSSAEHPTKLMSTTALLELPSLLPHHTNALTRTLKRLHLTPCSKLDRQEAEADSSSGTWPQLVSLTDTEYDTPICPRVRKRNL